VDSPRRKLIYAVRDNAAWRGSSAVLSRTRRSTAQPITPPTTLSLHAMVLTYATAGGGRGGVALNITGPLCIVHIFDVDTTPSHAFMTRQTTRLAVAPFILKPNDGMGVKNMVEGIWQACMRWGGTTKTVGRQRDGGGNGWEMKEE